MWNDPIVNEVRAAREAYSARFGHDLGKIASDLRSKQKAAKAARPVKKRVAKNPRPRRSAGR